MKYNEALKNDVINAFSVEPLLQGVKVQVNAINGTVTLSGTVDSYVKKRAAENVANKVAGVNAVVEKIKVKFDPEEIVTDESLASEVLKVIKFSPDIAENSVCVLVEDGCITLEGSVRTVAEKIQTERNIQHLSGVKMIVNNIAVQFENDDERQTIAIENELLKNWAIDDQDIRVTVVGNQVTLRGKVTSMYQRDTAERIAWNALGVCNVHNKLTIE
ncbi:BON domain-containing protein [Pedobacter changchengzhani]|uniref:BON domain-containing protein n=1 Tax=Pedobacter changchengzhani TaxID=2529274 RepID=A0A4R5MLG9_9SPHI|nr:BON domain-containing protein [Pedobacter changchengzhani]TDG36478.1 BON domain-containing protein [Pedobacter changchengzhani]